MTWIYTNAPETVDLDAIRLLIGDVNTANQLLTDEEIEYLYSVYGNKTLTVVEFS